MPSSLRARPLVACALALTTTLAANARAQTAGEKAAAAQALFDEAMRLVKEGRSAEACPKLEESLRLDAGMATQFRLAECYEKTGKLASAWATFVAVADAAAAARLSEREVSARKRADALSTRLPKLTIMVPPSVAALDGIEVLRDGVVLAKPLWGVPVPVDPGAHAILARAPGKKTWEGTVTAVEANAMTLPIPELAAAPASSVAPPVPQPSHRRSLVPGLVLGGVAVAAAGAGGALFGLHAKQLSDAQTLSTAIKGAHGTCAAGAPSVDSRCGDLASKASSADTLGNASTVAFVAGGAAAVAAVVYLLWPSAPEGARAFRAAPVVGAGQGGLSFSGSF